MFTGAFTAGTAARRLMLPAAAALCAPAVAQRPTPAGTRITNVAAVAWTVDGAVRRAASNAVTITVEEAEAALVKTQSVRAPDGSARAVSGAVVTYTLAARLPAGAEGARIDDPVPAGASYVPGSLRLDGTPLTDAADDDAGRFDGAAVAVALDPGAAARARTVTFQVRLT